MDFGTWSIFYKPNLCCCFFFFFELLDTANTVPAPIRININFFPALECSNYISPDMLASVLIFINLCML